ncbi:MAG: acyltransferase domain-containing protein, partial [Acidobacteriota bacterium]
GVLEGPLGLDLRTLLFDDGDAATAQLTGTALAQPALFVVEWSLARLWRSWGVEPRALAGHSLGEFVAAAVAGVFERDRALALVAERGRLMATLPPGSMLAVPLAEDEVLAQRVDGVDLATINGPTACVVSGPEAAVARQAAVFAAGGIDTRTLHTSHAFHSAMMDPILDDFRSAVEAAQPRSPGIPFVSNPTGDWISAEEATDPEHWVRHLRRAVRLGDGLGKLFELPDAVFLEVGPGRTLSSLARRHPQGGGRTLVPSLPHPREDRCDAAATAEAVGRLWVAGVDFDAEAFWADQDRRRVVLPTYPFERRRCWIEPRDAGAPGSMAPLSQSGESEGIAPESAPPSIADQGALEGETAGPGPAPFPGTPTEARVAEVWGLLLGVEAPGLHDNFYDLGGHSLLATQMANRLRAVFDVPIRSGQILGELSTIAAQASWIDEQLGLTAPEGSVEPPPAEPADLGDAELEALWDGLSEDEAAVLLQELAIEGEPPPEDPS